MEWRSIGSYTIRLHEMDYNNRELPTGEFYSGLVWGRDRAIENVFLIDVDGDGKRDVVVTVRCVGTQPDKGLGIMFIMACASPCHLFSRIPAEYTGFSGAK
jgi:hypothetical protein